VSHGEADEGSEEFLSIGSDRRRLLTGRRGRVATVLSIAGLALAVLLTMVVRGDRGGRQLVRPSPGPVQIPAPVHPPPSPAADQEYLIAVPAQDMAAALADPACQARCVASNLTGAALRRAGAAFAGLDPLAGGTVVDGRGRAFQQSIEALATPDALVHLVVRRDGSAPADRASVRERSGGGARMITVTRLRAGWRLTATIVVRGTAPPIDAATVWAATTRLPA
jgi:hypothetical protein